MATRTIDATRAIVVRVVEVRDARPRRRGGGDAERATPACRHRPRAIRGGERDAFDERDPASVWSPAYPFRCRGGERLSPTGSGRSTRSASEAAAAAVSRRCRSTVNRWYGLRCGPGPHGRPFGRKLGPQVALVEGFDDLDGCRAGDQEVHEELAPFMRHSSGVSTAMGGGAAPTTRGRMKVVMGCRCDGDAQREHRVRGRRRRARAPLRRPGAARRPRAPLYGG